MTNSTRLLATWLLCTLCCQTPLWADATTTTNNGAWDGSIWDVRIPQDGDTVSINHNVTISNASASVASCTVSAGKTLTFSTTNAVLNATHVTVNGTITHNVNSATTTNESGQWVMNNRVRIVCTNLTVATGGVINANARGYAGAPGGAPASGYGPGGGGGTDSSGGGGSGGSYGGRAGGGYGGATLAATYGNAEAPVYPGSGGGADSQAEAGGAGGGLVIIEATNGSVMVNGAINANGGSASACLHTGGGSGGGVYIGCRTFAGTNGVVSAQGGGGGWQSGGGGGGGRIAVIVDSTEQSNCPRPSVSFYCNTGTGGLSAAAGVHGTLYVSDSQVLPEVFPGSAYVSGFSIWTPQRLVVSNGWINMTNRLDLNTIGDLSLMGATVHLTNASSVQCGGSMRMTNASLYFYREATGTNGPSVRVGGNLTFDGGALTIDAGLTNAVAPYGGLVSVIGNVTMTTGSWFNVYSHPTNGGGVMFLLGSVSVSGGGGAGFNANGGGFSGANNNTNTRGNGPGGGWISTAGGYGSGGGGYGGRGGTGNYGYGVGGNTYGSSNAPTESGSGGGPSVWAEGNGGAGGGLIQIQAERTIYLDGTIRANGASVSGFRCGGGSGGGIYLCCRKFCAGTNGVMSANGGTGCRQAGGGGGGRIAVWRTQDSSTAVLTPLVNGGDSENRAGDLGGTGFPGTVVWGWIPLSGTVFVVR